MSIDDLTVGEVKQLAGLLNTPQSSSQKQHAFEVGKSYFIRTVTHHYLGTVQEINGLCIVMTSCVWVADDGRFHILMKGEWDGNSEREPFPPEKRVQVFYGAMLDAVEWTNEIPTSEK